VFVSWKKPTQQTRNFPLFPEAPSEVDDIAVIPAETASVLNVLRFMYRLVLPESSKKMLQAFWPTFPKWRSV
jgi:hypothetical protein